jgi:hypothetical protein
LEAIEYRRVNHLHRVEAEVLGAQTIIMLVVVSLVLDGVEGFIFDFIPCPASAHDMIDIFEGDGKAGDQIKVFPFRLAAQFPVFHKEMHMDTTDTTYFRVNTPRVAHETIDGETIMLDYETGAYFSMNDIGAEIWRLMQSRTPEQISAVLIQRYAGEPNHILEMVKQFLEKLHAEMLIIPVNDGAVPFCQDEIEIPTENRPFTPPEFHKYTDMEDLLLLDPIHDVDELGWPMKKNT